MTVMGAGRAEPTVSAAATIPCGDSGSRPPGPANTRPWAELAAAGVRGGRSRVSALLDGGCGWLARVEEPGVVRRSLTYLELASVPVRPDPVQPPPAGMADPIPDMIERASRPGRIRVTQRRALAMRSRFRIHRGEGM